MKIRSYSSQDSILFKWKFWACQFHSILFHSILFFRSYSCLPLSKYLPISWKQWKEQSHAQCHVTHRIRIFDKISEYVKVAKSVDIAVPELAVTLSTGFISTFSLVMNSPLRNSIPCFFCFRARLTKKYFSKTAPIGQRKISAEQKDRMKKIRNGNRPFFS